MAQSSPTQRSTQPSRTRIANRGDRRGDVARLRPRVAVPKAKPKKAPFEWRREKIAAKPRRCTDKIERAFWSFHTENPEVYRVICEIAYEMVDSGFNKIGINFISEIVRWKVMMKTKDQKFKMSNNHRPFYARVFMKEHPQYEGLFRTNRGKHVK